MINARAETIVEKPAFRKAFAKRRCLVPMTGFYEWAKGRRGKVPHYVRLRNSDLFTCAGLWKWWKSPEGEWVASFTIIVTDANKLISPLHERMPVVLAQEDHDAWLDPKNQDVRELVEFLQPYPADEMTAYAVSTRVNDVKNDGPELIEPARQSGARASRKSGRVDCTERVIPLFRTACISGVLCLRSTNGAIYPSISLQCAEISPSQSHWRYVARTRAEAVWRFQLVSSAADAVSPAKVRRARMR
jgi:SOS response associated peptidase (SRAP)